MQARLSNITDGQSEHVRVEYRLDGRTHTIEITDKSVRVWIDGYNPVSYCFSHHEFRAMVERMQINSGGGFAATLPPEERNQD